MGFLKIDSDQAFATAQKHGGDKILEADPKTPVFYVCDWNHNTNQLMARHLWSGTRRFEADRGGQRLDRRVHPGGEVGPAYRFFPLSSNRRERLQHASLFVVVMVIAFRGGYLPGG